MAAEEDERGRLEAMVEGLYWWGIPTLFRAPPARDPAECDIALAGVPHSTGNGTTERDQHLGPRAVRDVSAMGRRVHAPFRIDPWEACRIRDLGDVALPEGNDNEASIARITDFYAAVGAAGARAVSIGGDHSVTGGILQGLSRSALTGGRPVALVHLDAHTDTYAKIPHFLGAVKSAAHWGQYLVEQGQVVAGASTQIGIRGHTRSFDWIEPSTELGYRVIPMGEVREMGVEAVVEEARDRVGDLPVYITFDLDCLDPTVAPGVANLEAGEDGFRMDEAVAILRGLRGLDIVGGDVVCLMPTKDSPNKITALRAMAVMFEMICLIGDRLRG